MNMHFRKVIVLWAICCTLSLLALGTELLDPAEWRAFDRYSRLINPVTAPDNLVIIEIDQQSIEAASQQFVYWPWPRQTYSDILNHLAEADAVFIDLFFLESSSYGVDDDSRFAEGIRSAGNVFLPVRLSNEKKSAGISTAEIEFLRTKTFLPASPISGPAFDSVDLPIPPLRKSVAGAGNATVRPDHDGIFRRIPLTASIGDIQVPQFIVSQLLHSGKLTVRNGQFFAGEIPVPLVQGEALLRYYREVRPFTTIPILELFNAFYAEKAGSETKYPRSFFRGKTVFIGPTAGGLYDQKPTPIAPVSSGILINATLHANLSTGSLFKPAHPLLTVTLIAILTLAMAFIIVRTTSLTINLIGFCLLVVSGFCIAAFCFAQGTYLPIMYGPAAVTLTFLIGAVNSYATEGKQRREIKKTFTKYMDKTLVEHVLKNPHLMHPGGERYLVTVFFSDMAGFTTLSEKLDPQALALVLHRAHTVFTRVIINHGGVIDKYIGDAVMAFWGAPLRKEDDEVRACSAALECIKALAALNQDLQQEGLSPIAIRIGMHTGDAIVGNMGSEQVFDFTAVGDTVNLASRLEGANKYFGTTIMASEETISRTGETFITRELGMIAVKGKTVPVKILELLGTTADASPELMERCTSYASACRFLRERKIVEAEQEFSALADRFPQDGAARFHRDRCRKLLHQGELTDDPFHITMTDK